MYERHTLDKKVDALNEELCRAATNAAIGEALKLLLELRKHRRFPAMIHLAEKIIQRRPGDPLASRLYAQALIEQGQLAAALALLDQTLRHVPDDHSERAELLGLKGRAHKQQFVDSISRVDDIAQGALQLAVEAYREPFERQPANYWHGINLAACLHAARRYGLPLGRPDEPEEVARQVLVALDASAGGKPDAWWLATKGEALVALQQWPGAEEALGAYARHPDVEPFQLAGTLRQLRDVWSIEGAGDVGMALIQLLEAQLLRLEGASLSLRPSEIVQRRQQDADPDPDLLERVLGDTDSKPLFWYRKGLERAASVACVRRRSGGRTGTAFAVSANAFGEAANNKLLVLTNYHVVNREGASPGDHPDAIEVVFEAAGSGGVGPFRIRRIIAESPFMNGLDYALLELEADAVCVPPLPLGDRLPPPDSGARVYIIGHPRGEEVHIAFQDNRLLDHEGPPAGEPDVPERRRLHYRTPTSKGNSGSPVFDDAWDTIALHHAGAVLDPPERAGMSRLNRKPGRYSANQGYWIASIINDVRTATSLDVGQLETTVFSPLGRSEHDNQQR